MVWKAFHDDRQAASRGVIRRYSRLGRQVGKRLHKFDAFIGREEQNCRAGFVDELVDRYGC